MVIFFMKQALACLLKLSKSIDYMKVGIVHNLYLMKGGEDVMVEQECQLLRKNKVAAEVLYFKNSSSKRKQIVQFLLAFYNPFSSRLVSRWIDDIQPDLIHLHNWHYAASPAVVRAAKKKGVPVVHTLHNFRLLCPSGTLLHNNVISTEYRTNRFPWQAVMYKVYRNSFLQTFWLALTVWINKINGTWKSIDKYIVLTQHAEQVFQSSDIISREKIAVKPNFISDVPEEDCERQSHFLYTGRLSEEKGIEVLLNAFAHNGHQIKIVGDGPMRGMVEAYAEKYSNIIYLGFKDKHSIIKELKACTALVFSSIWFEGNPLTIIEALACGTVVIASNLGAMQSMITDGYNGLHFLPGSESDLAAKVDSWYRLSAYEKADFYKNARQSYLDNYTPAKNFEKLFAIYKSVVNHGKAKPVELVY